MERLEPVCIADGMYNGAATAEAVWKLLKELKNFQGSSGETDTNRPMGLQGGEVGVGEMCGESKGEVYNTTCRVDSQWEFSVWLRELKQGLHDRLKGGMWRDMGGRSRRKEACVYLWLVLVDV